MLVLEILYSNQSDSEKIIALKERLKQEVSLDLSKDLALGDNKLMNLIIPALEDNYTLTSLVLSNINLSYASLTALAQVIKKHPKIERFHLVSMTSTSGLMRLRKIRFSIADEETGRYVMLFETFLSGKLTHLSLCGFSVDLKDMQALAQGLSINTQLKSLDLRANGINEQEAKILARGLANNSSLTSLNISHNLIEFGVSYLTEVIKSKKNFSSFSCLDDTYELDLCSVQRLITNPNLRELEFSSTGTSHAVEAFYKLIKNNKTLDTLRIAGFDYCSKGISALSEVLIKNRTLKTFDLSFSRIQFETHCGNRNPKIYDAYHLLFQALEKNKNLTSLNLKNIDLHKFFVQKLTFVLKRNKYLTELEIDCKIEDQGIIILADFLAHNLTLKKLKIRSQSSINLKPIVQALTTNSSLTALELPDYYSPEAISLLSEILKNNHTLIELKLAFNSRILKPPAQSKSELISRHENLCPSEWVPIYYTLIQNRPDIITIGPFLERNRRALYTHEIKQFAKAIPPYFPLELSRIIADYAGLPPEAPLKRPLSFLTHIQNKINHLWEQFKHLAKRCLININNLVKTLQQTQMPLRRPQSTISLKQTKQVRPLIYSTIAGTLDTALKTEDKPGRLSRSFKQGHRRDNE